MVAANVDSFHSATKLVEVMAEVLLQYIRTYVPLYVCATYVCWVLLLCAVVAVSEEESYCRQPSQLLPHPPDGGWEGGCSGDKRPPLQLHVLRRATCKLLRQIKDRHNHE